jgi:hypothetical protein
MGFGFVSKRFEWQADLFGARSVTPPANECNQPCPYHGTALPGNTESDPLSATMPKSTLCATGATVFAETLHEIAALNGIPINARSWRHSSIANRIQQLKAYPHNPAMLRKLECGVIAIKTVLIVGTAIGLAIALYLYWPVR